MDKKSLVLLVFLLSFSLLFFKDTSAITYLYNDTVGGTAHTSAIVGTVFASKVVAGSSGNLTSLGVNMVAGGMNIRLALYSNNATGDKPDSFLAGGNSTSSSAGWNSLALNKTIAITKGTIYWLAFQGNGAGDVYDEGIAGTTRNSYYGASYSDFPTSWWAASIERANYATNMRMTYNATANLLGNCTDGTTIPTLNYTIVDENTLNPITGNAYMTHNILYNQFSFTFTNVNSFANCLSSSTDIFHDTGTIQYVDTAGVYATRYFWLDNWAINNVTQPIYLFLLNNTAGYNVQITLKDQNSNLITNAYLWIERYYPSTNSYGVVEILPTSAQGTTSAFLQLYTAYYKFVVTQNGVVLGTIPPQLLTSTSFTSYLPSNATSPFLIYYNKQGGNYTYDYPTGNITGYYNDISGYLTNATFTVNQVGALQSANICTITNTTLQFGSMTCHIGDATGKVFSITLIGGISDGNTNLLISAVFQYNPNNVSFLFGSCTGSGIALCQEGAIITFFILIVCALMGLYSPTAAILFTCVGLGASMLMGLFVINITTLAGLFFIAAVIIFKLRGGSNA